MADGLLPLMLDAAVPLWMLRVENYSDEQRRARAESCVAEIAEHGDAIVYRIPGRTATAFNALAEGIACLATMPGGVTAFGRHWEAPPAERR